MINCMHYYAFRNNVKELKIAFENHVPYLKSTKAYPLEISLLLKNVEVSGAIISSLRKKTEKIENSSKMEGLDNEFILESLNDCIVELNNQGFRGLDDLYRDCLIKNKRDLPKFCRNNIKLPRIHFAASTTVTSEEFFAKNEIEDGQNSENFSEEEKIEQRIVFYTSCLRINLAVGSSESLEFLQSLLNCSNTDIFTTKYVKTLLEYK